MTDFVPHRLSSRSLKYQFIARGTVHQLADYLPSLPFIFSQNKALGVFLALLASLVSSGNVLAAVSEEETVAQKMSESFASFEQSVSLSANPDDLCAWERDLGFFLTPAKGSDQSDRIDCSLRLQQQEVGELKEAYQPADEALAQELGLMVTGFPIEVMTKAIAEYDREIAGLIVGIGKKESNWGKRTPKLSGEECFNFWGYRGAGTRGFTPDGYGCWEKPEEAVKTIGDRLVKLRDLRQSTEPARMIVWKCGSTCAGHSDESVRKWIADVNIYYRKIAQK